jgi:uncharacterized membrane protein
MVIEHELTIDAPDHVVWRLTEDVEGWPTLTPTMTSIERLDDGPLHVGSRARVKQPAQRATVWTVTRLEPSELFEWEANVFGVRMVGRHRITADGDSCRNTLQIEMSGRGSGVLGALTGGRIRKAIATENEGFKRAAEAVRR